MWHLPGSGMELRFLQWQADSLPLSHHESPKVYIVLAEFGAHWRRSTKNTQWVHLAAAAAAKSLQSCLTLCDPIDGSPPGSPVPGILQARTLEWVAISFSDAWKWKVKGKSLSRVWLLATPWTAAYQAFPSMGFSRQEYWSGVPLPSPEYILASCNVRQRGGAVPKLIFKRTSIFLI